MPPNEPNVPAKLLVGVGFTRLVDIMARLRSPEGCPWDREQTFDAIEAINSKLVRRHPHVFGEGEAKTAADVIRKWDEIKATEKAASSKPKGLLGGIPRSLPALMEARQIAGRAAAAGFDWSNVEQVLEKLHEELAELEGARNTGSPEALQDEIGDLLFVIVNIARFLKVDPEQALRGTNSKFRRRFAHVEKGLEAQGKSLDDATIEEMERHWQDAKGRETKDRGL
jgi:MazG family protein